MRDSVVSANVSYTHNVGAEELLDDLHLLQINYYYFTATSSMPLFLKATKRKNRSVVLNSATLPS
jgi:hypothetical protein